MGIRVENGEVVKATASLNSLEVAGAKAEIAAQRLGRRMGLAEIEARKLDAAMKESAAQAVRSGALMEIEAHQMDKARDAMDRAARSANLLKVGLGAVAVVGFIGHETIKNTIEAQNAMAQLEAAVASTGGVAGRTVAQLDALSVSLQKQTTYSDEAVKGAEAMLLTFDKIRGANFDRATQAVTDLAARMGGDLQGAAVQVGKALQDPTTGLTALRRSGVSFSESQIAVIKNLYETGHAAEGQRVILKELEHQFGGSAAAARDTLGGALEGLKNSFGDLFEVTRGGSQGTVDAINAITKSLEDSGLSMNTFVTNTVIGWNNIATAAQKANNYLSIDLTKGLGAELERVKAINERLDFDRNAEEARLRHPAKVGAAVGGGGGGGAGRDADGLTSAEREAQRIADQQANARNQLAIDEIHKREKEADEARRKQEDYVNDIAAIWDKGIHDVVSSTERGFQAILESVGGFAHELSARMAKDQKSSEALKLIEAGAAGGAAGFGFGQSVFSTSHGAAGNTVRGAFGGASAGALAGAAVAGPAGAAAGALTGLVGGILGIGSASKEAAKAMAEAMKNVTLSMDALRATVTGDTLAQAIVGIEADRAKQIQQIEDAWSGGGAGSDRVVWRTKQEAEINRLEDERIAKLKEEYAISRQRQDEDLRVRLLVAQGRTKEADALRLQLDQERERYALVQSFGPIIDAAEQATLSLLDQVQAQERLATATKNASASALNMVESYNLQKTMFDQAPVGTDFGWGYKVNPGDTTTSRPGFGGPNGPFPVPTGPATGTPQPVAPVIMQPVVLQVDGREMARVVKRVFVDQASKSGDGDAFNWGQGFQ